MFRTERCVALLLALIATASAAAAHALTVDALAAAARIDEARAAAASNDHAAAIDAFLSAIAADSTRADVVAVELGAQYTWAGRHDEAIRTLLSYTASHPESVDALLLLALAQSWNDRPADALATYRTVARIDPANAGARLGEARMLSWCGDLGASLARYEAFLSDHPEDRDARLGHATVVNWMGDHRRAAALFADAARDDPGDTAPIEGLATAWNWAGRPDRSLALLSRVGRQGDAAPAPNSQGLESAIRSAWRPAATLVFDHARDSDEFTTSGARVEGEVPIAFRGRVRPTIQRTEFRIPDRKGAARELWCGAAFENRVSDSWLVYGDCMGLVDAPEAIGPGTGVTGAVHAAWLPHDRVRVDAGYARNSLFRFDPTGGWAPRRLGFDIVDAGLSWRPHWRTTLLVSGDRGWYADGNRRVNVRARVRRSVLDRPRLGLEAGVQSLDYIRPGTPGLWTPDAFRSLVFAIDADAAVRRGWSLFGRIDTGWAHERGADTAPTFSGTAGARIETARVRIEARASRSDSNIETGRGYRRSAAGVTGRVSF